MAVEALVAATAETVAETVADSAVDVVVDAEVLLEATVALGAHHPARATGSATGMTPFITWTTFFFCFQLVGVDIDFLFLSYIFLQKKITHFTQLPEEQFCQPTGVLQVRST